MDKIIEEDISKIKKKLAQFKGKIKGKVFLVTGGAGFLGSWSCDVLDAFDAKIICIDNLSSGTSKNIRHLSGRENFEFINADVCTFTTKEKIDYIVHMASIASPLLYQKFSIKTIDANVVGTKNMLELARKNKILGFLFASTSEIYGDPSKQMIPTPEDYYGAVNPIGSRAMYNESKRCAETYCHFYWEKYKLPIRIARIFNTYGPRLDLELTSSYGRAIINFIRQSLTVEPVTVFGNGKQTRSFCYITDQMIGLFKLLLTPKIDGEVINVGNDEEITILQLAKKIINLTNSKSKIVFRTLSKDDPRRRQPDLSKANKLLNFYPDVTLEKGLKRTINWIKSERLNSLV